MKKLQPLVHILLFYGIAYMPRWLCRLAARICTHWLINRPNLHKHRIAINLRILLSELSQEERMEYTRLNLRFLTGLLFEVPHILLRERSKVIQRITEVKGKNLAVAAHRHNKGVILMLPHLGNWEILAPYLGREFPCTALYKPLYNGHLDAVVRNYRTEMGMKLVPTNRTGIKQLLLSLQRKEYAIILPDQNPGNQKAQLNAKFFGVPMPTPSLLPQLRARTNARILCVFAIKLPDDNYRIEFHPPADAVYADDIGEAVQGVNTSVENCVRLYPTQYQWPYRMLAGTLYRLEYLSPRYRQ